MANQLTESKWNPVQLGGRTAQSGGYNIDTHSVSSGWYNRYVDSRGSRRTKLRRYEEMDKESVEISRALDIMAEDVSSCNADDQDIFNLDIPDDSKILKSHIKLLETAKDTWASRTRLDHELFNRVRDTLKFGATFWHRQKDGTHKKLRPERIVGHIRAKDDEEVVTHYIYDPNGASLDSGQQKTVVTGNRKSSEDFIPIPVDEMIVLKVGDGPYGKSVLEQVYKVWRQMSLVEDAVIIYRVVRAPERRVYYIDVGNLQGPKREQAIEKQRLRLMQRNLNKNNQMSTDYDPHSTSEDIFIPTNSMGKGSRIETLPAGQNLGELSDLQWFAKKVAAGLRIPFSMLDTFGEQNQQQTFSDMRVGQVYQVEMRYVGYIRRIQRLIAEALHNDYYEFCRSREITVPFDVNLEINPPTSFAKYKDIEVNQATLNVFNSTLQIGSLSKKFALQKYLDLDQEDIAYNEIEKLKEKGLTEEEIKAMDQSAIDNIVYGDGRLGEKYGLAAADPNAGGGYGF